jgi:hypothetical protein
LLRVSDTGPRSSTGWLPNDESSRHLSGGGEQSVAEAQAGRQQAEPAAQEFFGNPRLEAGAEEATEQAADSNRDSDDPVRRDRPARPQTENPRRR